MAETQQNWDLLSSRRTFLSPETGESFLMLYSRMRKFVNYGQATGFVHFYQRDKVNTPF